jgi:hypothetical protein
MASYPKLEPETEDDNKMKRRMKMLMFQAWSIEDF